jgi:serine/threonine protein kinase
MSYLDKVIELQNTIPADKYFTYLRNVETSFLLGIRKLCDKLNFINKLGFIDFNHRDMKSDNIMVTTDIKGFIKNIYFFSC